MLRSVCGNSDIIQVHSAEHLASVRGLFRQYERSLSIDLCFQNFEEELASLPGRYAPPSGRLLLGLLNGEPAGCVALRDLGHGICEMKRLFVPPKFRSRGFGRQLAVTIIRQAQDIGYTRMRLDTLTEMNSAIRLYQSLGFVPTTPYCANPSPQALYYELDLARVKYGFETLTGQRSA